MDVYDQIIKADMQGSDVRPALQELAMRPPEDRYISRIVAALGFAFGDLDSRCIGFDLETLPIADLERIRKLLEIRAAQFCMLLRKFLERNRRNAFYPAPPSLPVQTRITCPKTSRTTMNRTRP